LKSVPDRRLHELKLVRRINADHMLLATAGPEADSGVGGVAAT